MEHVMQAICATAAHRVTVQQVPKPTHAAPGYLLLKMRACAINPGDKAFIGRTTFAPGTIPVSHYDIYGASGAGQVLAVGPGVPPTYTGKRVAVYRSLQFSDQLVGLWSEYAHVPYLDCVLLPDDVPLVTYAGSLVNVITPYAFWQQIVREGHRGIICTAGTSATGIALLGVCLAYGIPLVSIVRTAAGKRTLEALGATCVVVQEAADFTAQLQEAAQRLATTAVFDGVGGEILTQILDVLPANSTIYCYGYLGDSTPLTIHTSALMRGLTIKAFSNFKTVTVQDPHQLATALTAIEKIIHLPHFVTKIGREFKLEKITAALQFVAQDGGKAILCPAGGS
ncbi:MAG: zinc-binding dehydrogenase [Janthinobacterium lividum]